VARTLEDMKRDRGGRCHNCGIDIMSPLERDHTFCNICWNKMLAHPYVEYIAEDGSIMCDSCAEPEDHPLHGVD
jgi:DNA-directed RNA polymerase subunit RPC12/RpoP